MRTSFLSATAALLVAGAAFVSPANAHHSFAMFDSTKARTLNGVVQEFRWTNPHVALFVQTNAAAGAPSELWAVELTSPGNLTRLGWNRRSLKAGDKVAVEINPLRDGKKGGGFRRATLVETGQVLEARLIEVQNKAGD